MLPNFIIGGTSAGGTSFLTSILIQHRDIFLPKNLRPEPHFFYYTHKYEKGLDWYQAEWFSECGDEKAVGERSSSYLYHAESMERIRKDLPNIKLIFVLRNPVERAWANYRYTVLSGLEPLSFEEALDQEDRRVKEAEGIWAEVQPHDYTGRSMYGQQMELCLKLFSRDQILIVGSEKLNSDTRGQLQRITDFLQVDPVREFEMPPKFSSLSVVDPVLQVRLRNEMGPDLLNKVVEAIRKKEDLSSYGASDQDVKNILALKENVLEKKEPIPASLKERLEFYFEEDKKKFFGIAGAHVDFDPWF